MRRSFSNVTLQLSGMCLFWEGKVITTVNRGWNLKGLGIPIASHPGEPDSEIWRVGLNWEEGMSILSQCCFLRPGPQGLYIEDSPK